MATITWACPQCGRERQDPINVGDYESARALIRQLREDFDKDRSLFLCVGDQCEGKLYPLRIEGVT